MRDRGARCGGQWLGGVGASGPGEGDKGDMSYIRCHLPEVQHFRGFAGGKRQNAHFAKNKILFRAFETKLHTRRAPAATPVASETANGEAESTSSACSSPIPILQVGWASGEATSQLLRLAIMGAS